QSQEVVSKPSFLHQIPLRPRAILREVPCLPTSGEPMPPEFSFRLNGTIVPMLFIQKERVDGKLTGKKRLKAVWIDGVGRFAIDDDSHPWEFTVPQHVLEYRNET